MSLFYAFSAIQSPLVCKCMQWMAIGLSVHLSQFRTSERRRRETGQRDKARGVTVRVVLVDERNPMEFVLHSFRGCETQERALGQFKSECESESDTLIYVSVSAMKVIQYPRSQPR